MGNDTLSLSDEIYSELLGGLKTGDLNWTGFLAKYSANKGVLYDAIGRFFRDIQPELKALNEVQTQLKQAGLKLDSLDQKIGETDQILEGKNHDIAALEEKENALKKHLEALEGDLERKRKLLDQLQELERLSFGEETLRTLHAVLVEVGAKRGLKPDKAVNTFFAELKDYDAIQGFNRELQRLDTIVSTKSLQAKKWQAEAESLEGRYKELQGAVAAIQSLNKQGVKPEQLTSWNSSLTSIGGVDELEKGLGHYKSVQKLLAAKRREGKRLDTKLAKVSGAVKTLKEQKLELEGSTKALRVSAIEELERISQVSTEKINMIAQTGANSVAQAGQTALGELKEALSLIDELSARALEVGKLIGQIESKLGKSKETREKTEALVAAVETRR